MLYMLFKDRSTCISIDLVVGNNISNCLIIVCELKLGFEIRVLSFAKDLCVLMYCDYRKGCVMYN